MLKLAFRLLGICLALSVPLPVAAGTIVDTGTPIVTGLTNWSFYNKPAIDLGQYFAGQFTTADSYYLQTIEGFFGNQFFNSADGSVTIGIHSAGLDNNPGTLLYSANVNLAAGAPVAWYGVSGSNYLLAPGTYWASFTPSAEIQGTMPGIAPLPLGEYALGALGSWLENPTNFRDSLAVGVRINADLASSVPDATSTLNLLAGVVLLAIAAHRFSS